MSEAKDPEGLSTTEAETLLLPISKVLQHDGYELDVQVVGDGLELAIRATPEACAECLVPASIMEGIVRAALGKGDAQAEHRPLHIQYPEPAADTDGTLSSGRHHGPSVLN
jgi:hypothetical protein